MISFYKNFVFATFLVANTFLLVGQDSQKTLVFETEKKINYKFGLDQSILLALEKSSYFLLSFSSYDPYLNNKKVDTIFEFDMKSDSLKSKITFNHSIIPESVVNESVQISSFQITNDLVYISAGQTLVLLKIVDENLEFSKVIRTGIFIKSIKPINDQYTVVSSNYPDKQNNFNISLINIKTEKTIKTINFNFHGGFFGLLSGNQISTSNSITAVADPAKYQIILMNNLTFDILDTLSNNTNRKCIPDDIIFNLKSKSDFSTLNKYRTQYFNIIKIQLLSDNMLMIIKADFDTIAGNYFIDFFEKRNSNWEIVLENIKVNHSEDNFFSKEVAFYPFAADLPNIVANENEIYLVRNFLNLDASIGLKFSDILSHYRNQPFSIYSNKGLSKYIIENKK